MSSMGFLKRSMEFTQSFPRDTKCSQKKTPKRFQMSQLVTKNSLNIVWSYLGITSVCQDILFTFVLKNPIGLLWKLLRLVFPWKYVWKPMKFLQTPFSELINPLGKIMKTFKASGNFFRSFKKSWEAFVNFSWFPGIRSNPLGNFWKCFEFTDRVTIETH